MLMPARRGLVGSVAAHAASGGGPAPYVAQGVHFDGATWLSIISLLTSDNGTASGAFFLKYDATVATVPTVWIADPENLYGNFIQPTNPQFNWITEVEDAGAPNSQISNRLSSNPGAGWLPVVWSADVRRGTPVIVTYVGETSIGQPPNINGPFTGTSLLQFNGVSFWVGSDGFGSNLIGDLALHRLWAGRSLLDGSGDISAATRRLFYSISGVPVAPDVANTAIGVPDVWLEASVGNAASFATNRGSGGAFATTGTLTLSATSPSD